MVQPMDKHRPGQKHASGNEELSAQLAERGMAAAHWWIAQLFGHGSPGRAAIGLRRTRLFLVRLMTCATTPAAW
jgi:hypothetical protein